MLWRCCGARCARKRGLDAAHLRSATELERSGEASSPRKEVTTTMRPATWCVILLLLLLAAPVLAAAYVEGTLLWLIWKVM